MKIDQVTIKNFKSLREVDINLRNLTLIAGVNSSGKSSLIQALLLMKQNSENIQQSIMFHSILEDMNKNGKTNQAEALLKTISPFILDGEYITLGDAKSLLYQEAFQEPIVIQLSCNNKWALNLTFDVESKFEVDLSNEDDSAYNFISTIFANWHYICTDRVAPSITYPLSEQHVRKGHIGFNGEYSAHYLSKNRRSKLDVPMLKHPNSKTNQLLENVSKWLGEISNGIDISITIHNQLQIASLSYQYTYGKQTTGQYTPINIGFGVSYVLPVIVAILKSKPGDLVIIENPESHLHPKGQSKIAELCAIAAHNGVQIIVETHSDHFLNGIRVATKNKIITPEESQIYYFEKEKDSLNTITHAINIDEDGKLDEWPEGFFDEWDNQLNKLLW